MRMPLLILLSLMATSATAAESLRLPAERPQGGKDLGKALPLKGTAGTARAGSCASYGPRFVMVEGTGTCVKVGGSISVDTAIRR
ncbi:hypothetical protein [Bradyrhizobium sp. CCGE-LA001]|uniref:hypothetical protein n=1 Tax=Bradyrhizobium sp. CCGE-LA001 TaxID=1223566 RepID=UPI000745D804|nr:hypothetical protein [Bradyrhizobium sp. CCGE-LA001]AMA61322.1 hypothetical protein BCCGELA001_18475 [Bradyrhizobium sp. CCGE-LA001]